MATSNQIPIPAILGLPFQAGIVGSSLALNGASDATWLAYSFTPGQAKTINSVRAFMSAMNGTLAANDISCEIQTDSSGSPSGSNPTGGGAQAANATPAASTWIEFDGFTASLIAGTQYWIVLKNPSTTAGSPTTVYPTWRYFSGLVPQYVSPGITTTPYNWSKRQTTNSGGSWTAVANQIAGWSVTYSDGTYDGLPASSNTSTDSACKCFNNGTSSQEFGTKFTSPANATLDVAGISFTLGASAGVGPFKFRLYTGSSTSACTLLAETETIAVAGVGGTVPNVAHFATTQQIPPSTVCRLVIADASSTGSSSKYFAPNTLTLDSSCPAALLPFDGTMVKTSTTNGASAVGNSPGTAFTDAGIGTLMFVALLLDTNGEFNPTGNGCPVPFPSGQMMGL